MCVSVGCGHPLPYLPRWRLDEWKYLASGIHLEMPMAQELYLLGAVSCSLMPRAALSHHDSQYHLHDSLTIL